MQPNGKSKWDVQFSLGGYNNPLSDVAGFYDWIKEFEQQTVDTALSKSQDWFRKSITRNQAEDYWTGPLKHPKEGQEQYPPNFKAILPFK